MNWLRPACALAIFFVVGCAAPRAGQTVDKSEAEVEERLNARAAALSTFLKKEGSRAPSVAEGLVVELAFGAEADLDLYVTGPLLETVYFANHESKSGGKISSDGRCGGALFQIETVRFAAPMHGRYRVGVDYPKACNDELGPAAHAVRVSYAGKRLELSGAVELRQFEVIVLEFDVGATELEEVSE